MWAASRQNQQNDMCAQRRLRSAWASTQSDQSLLSAWRKLGSLTTHRAHSEDSDQTGRMPRLIWVFAGHSVILLVLRWGSLYIKIDWYLQKIILGIKTLDYRRINEPHHEIMALFVLRKRFIQRLMRSHPMGLGVWFLVGRFVYFHTLCLRTVKALARLWMRRLAWAFAGQLCDKHHNLMSWLRCMFCEVWKVFSHVW